MNTYAFSLLVEGFDEDKLDDLYDATEGDSTVEFGNGHFSSKVGFDREADSAGEAILEAVTEVEDNAGLRVLRVEPDDYVWAAEIATRTNRTRQNIDQLIRGQRGPGNFPAPVTGNVRNPLWRWTQVARWFAEYEGTEVDMEWLTTVAAINAALELRNNLPEMADKGLAILLGKILSAVPQIA